jgi:predicted nucleic acid-binding protein
MLFDRALALIGGLARNTIHDSLYLTLAELWGCEMWTLDRRFTRASRKRPAKVRCAGDDA